MAVNPGGPQPEASALEPSEVAELEAISSQQAYDRFLGAAMAVDEAAIEECHADVALVYYSINLGVANALARESELKTLPQLRLEDLQSLPELAQGLAFAVLQLYRNLQAASLGPLFERVQRLRRKLFKAADALSEAGLLDDADAALVRQMGRPDIVGDCLALVAVLRRNEERIAGHSPVAAADLEEAERLATMLQALFAPRGGPNFQPVPSFLEASQIRDRFWALINQRHELLWRCGAWLYGRQVDQHVPPLQARYTARPKVQLMKVAPQSQLAMASARNESRQPPTPPPPEKTGAMSALQRKFRALVSVSVGRPPR